MPFDLRYHYNFGQIGICIVGSINANAGTDMRCIFAPHPTKKPRKIVRKCSQLQEKRNPRWNKWIDTANKFFRWTGRKAQTHIRSDSYNVYVKNCDNLPPVHTILKAIRKQIQKKQKDTQLPVTTIRNSQASTINKSIQRESKSKSLTLKIVVEESRWSRLVARKCVQKRAGRTLAGPRQAGLFVEIQEMARSGKTKNKNKVCVAIKSGSHCGRRRHHGNAHTQHESKHPPPQVRSSDPSVLPRPRTENGVWGAMGRIGLQGEPKPFPCTSACFLPVLQLLRHALGDATAQQTHEEEQDHGHRQHAQDVRLGGGRENLTGEVGETFGRRYLLNGEWINKISLQMLHDGLDWTTSRLMRLP